MKVLFFLFSFLVFWMVVFGVVVDKPADFYTHLACQTNACIRVFGVGVDTCRINADCKNQHLECTAKSTCKLVFGYGPSTCLSDIDCSNLKLSCVDNSCRLVHGGGEPDQCRTGDDCQNRHLGCKDVGKGRRQCVVVAGKGPNECSNNKDCELTPRENTYMGCQNNRCVRVGTYIYPQPDVCATNRDCTNKHLECTKYRTCELVNGAGPSTCLNNSNCVNVHSSCVNNSCVVVNSDSGVDLCRNDRDCKNKHLECTKDRTCSLVDGAGPNKCLTNRDCLIKTRVLVEESDGLLDSVEGSGPGGGVRPSAPGSGGAPIGAGSGGARDFVGYNSSLFLLFVGVIVVIGVVYWFTRKRK